MYISIETEQGTVRGKEKTLFLTQGECFPDKKYYSFQGIPFAKPPVGSLRFQVMDRIL